MRSAADRLPARPTEPGVLARRARAAVGVVAFGVGCFVVAWATVEGIGAGTVAPMWPLAGVFVGTALVVPTPRRW